MHNITQILGHNSNLRCILLQSHLVVDAVEVSVETLVKPPAGVADLGTDVAGVRRAETLLVVVPTERVLHRSAETRHMEAVPVPLIIYPAGGGEDTSIFINKA